MHEFSTAVGIVETITEVAQKNNATKIKKVELVVGEFSMLNNEQLVFAFEVATEQTLAEGANLIIEGQAGEIVCQDCGYKGTIEKQNREKKEVDHFIVNLTNIFECPKCKSNNTKISGGRDIYVKNIEIEYETN